MAIAQQKSLVAGAVPLLALAALLNVTATAAQQPTDPRRAMQSDAQLNDVFFVDSVRGWAVGDRGAVWHTNDGGRHWHLQHSGVEHPLESVWFINERHGWAVGGWTHPYTHKTTAVVLRTGDGGRRWAAVERLTLPGLKRIKMFDTRRGWALGNASAMYPAGAFWTGDGGRSWTGIPGGGDSWLDGDFPAPKTGALAGRSGKLATVDRGGVQTSRTASLGLRHLRRLRLTGSTGGWLVGDGGLVMTTRDGGLSWQRPAGLLPEGMADGFDFAALAVRDHHCWIAGAPGSRVMHSSDGGRSWREHATGQSLPIRGLAFPDERHGWAVGVLGTILATRDGGQTWQRQRSGGQRAALLGVFSAPRDVPLELFVRLSAGDGYLGVVEILNRRGVELPTAGEADQDRRVHEALLTVGGSGADTAWRFPLRQLGLKLSVDDIIAGWDRATDGRGAARLEQHIVGKIRQWRPEVIITQGAAARAADSLDAWIARTVAAAAEKAADLTSYPDQITKTGLEPWKVKRVFATRDGQSLGGVNLTTAQLADRLGRSLADQASFGRGLLTDRYNATPPTIGFRRLVDHLPQAAGRADFFSGISLPAGGEARRQSVVVPAGSMATLRRMAQKRRNLRGLLAHSETGTPDAWLGQIADLTSGLDPAGGGHVLYTLAQRYRQTGRPEMAAETLTLLTERFPEHMLTEPALVWLLTYYASGEAAWRVRHGQQYAAGLSVFNAAAEPADEEGDARQGELGGPDLPDGAPANAGRGTRTELEFRGRRVAIGGALDEDRAQRAIDLGKQIRRLRPVLLADPTVGFCLSTAYRTTGLPREAEQFFHRLANHPGQEAWRACAQGEHWLAQSPGIAPKSIWQCAAAPARPRLDGKLDDAVWRVAKPVQLKSAQYDDARWPAGALMAYDRQFLYLAVSCRQAPEADYPRSEAPRPRDLDLTGRDRVDLLIDLDRDYASYWRLTIDYRGWTGEACLGDKTWNPKWYVAAATVEDTWTIEAAIPLEEITAGPPDRRNVWAVGIQRTVPGVGFQSWTQPAAVRVRPEGFGYLIFD